MRKFAFITLGGLITAVILALAAILALGWVITRQVGPVLQKFQAWRTRH